MTCSHKILSILQIVARQYKIVTKLLKTINEGKDLFEHQDQNSLACKALSEGLMQRMLTKIRLQSLTKSNENLN